jgi:hypothetical protein
MHSQSAQFGATKSVSLGNDDKIACHHKLGFLQSNHR